MKKLKNNGFTLIELSVVLILAGIIIASALVAYRLEIERRSITTTKKNLEIANTAIVEFQKTNGFYPCPASGTDTSARAGDCFNSSGTGFKRISIGSQVLRMGIMPISSRDKNGDIVQLIHGEKSFDGFRRRIVYAVLENHAKNAETFSAAGKGLITILNSNDISGTPASTSSYYVLFSAGPDGSGAYTPSGVLYTPCSSSTVDSENCDDDAVFVDNIGGARNLSGSNNHYDDFFTGQTEVPKINKSIGRIIGTAEVHGSYSMEHTTYTSANAKYTDENCLNVWGEISCEVISRSLNVIKEADKGITASVTETRRGTLLTCKKSKVTYLYKGVGLTIDASNSTSSSYEIPSYQTTDSTIIGKYGFWGCIDDGSDKDTTQFIIQTIATCPSCMYRGGGSSTE